MVRTMSEHIDRVAQSRPEVASLESFQAQKSAAAISAEKSNPSITVTITKDTITSSSSNVEPATTPYTVIGGNSRLVVIESTDEEGYESVANIRLVEGGIAIETTNCQEQPEQCKRERQQAMEKLRKKQDENRSTNTVISNEASYDGIVSTPPRNDLSQPRWVYFKPAN